MHEEERTFLLPGDHTDVFEVSRDGELVVDEAASTMHLVCFAVNSVGSALSRTVALITEAGAGVKEVCMRGSLAGHIRNTYQNKQRQFSLLFLLLRGYGYIPYCT